MTDSLPGIAAYRSGETTFAVGLRPQDALAIPLAEVLEALSGRFGDAVMVALSEAAVDLDRPLSDLPPKVWSPRSNEPDSGWMRRANVVGVNVRTVGDIGGLVKYALTLPADFDAIQLLPIWEPGVVKSLYGIAGWNLNYEFFSDELYEYAPNLDTMEKQLRAASNLLHVMGKTIGMDVIPHTDRFSEVVLGTPDLFEWMKVRDRQIVDHTDAVGVEAEGAVLAWLRDRGPAG